MAPSVNAFKRHLQSLWQKKMGYFMDSYSPHKPFWLLVMQNTIVICLRYMMIAIGAAAPGELHQKSLRSNIRWSLFISTSVRGCGICLHFEP